jgi:hypothetical protein
MLRDVAPERAIAQDAGGGIEGIADDHYISGRRRSELGAAAGQS